MKSVVEGFIPLFRYVVSEQNPFDTQRVKLSAS
jgi:hypothetical protein